MASTTALSSYDRGPETLPDLRALELQFSGRHPLSFAFTEGWHARFNVPFRHRFVVEHLNLSCCAEGSHLRVRLETKLLTNETQRCLVRSSYRGEAAPRPKYLRCNHDPNEFGKKVGNLEA